MGKITGLFALVVGCQLLARPEPCDAAEPLILSNETLAKVKTATAVVTGKHGHGSAFLVLPDVLATNAHVVCLESIADIKVKFISEKGKDVVYPVKLLAFDKARDLALLKIDATIPGLEPLAINTDVTISRKPDVFVVGNPAQSGGDLAIVNALGRATLKEEMVIWRHQQLYQLTMLNSKDDTRVGPGNSGGPVLDVTGRVIGVLSAGETDSKSNKPTSRAYCIPGSVLKSLIESVGSPREWDEKCRRATERHAFDLNVCCRYCNLLIAQKVLAARKSLWANAVHRNGLFLQLNGNPFKVDADLIALFETSDKYLAERMKGAWKLAMGGEEVSETDRRRLVSIKSDLEGIRLGVAKPRIKAEAEVKTYEKQIQDTLKLIDKVKAANGWDDEDFQNMLVPALKKAGVAIVISISPTSR